MIVAPVGRSWARGGYSALLVSTVGWPWLRSLSDADCQNISTFTDYCPTARYPSIAMPWPTSRSSRASAASTALSSVPWT